ADVRSGRVLVSLDGIVAGTDRLHAHVDAAPDADRFDLSVHAVGQRGGLLARAIARGRPVSVDVDGDGSWSRWRGRARGWGWRWSRRRWRGYWRSSTSAMPRRRHAGR
ncbi:hypothetical protein ACTGWF_10265, partial [Streptococcus suis]